jgi:hypothetical protein
MATNQKKPMASAGKASPSEANSKTLILEEYLTAIRDDIQSAIELLQKHTDDSALSTAERRRLQGSGIRRYGFIDKVSDTAVGNPEFIPPFMDEEELKDLIRQIELLRNISANLQQLLRMTNDELLLTGDEAFRIALMYYNSVRDASRRRVPGAQALFNMLRPFFTSTSRRRRDEPTEQEVERDVKALLHGKKDGEIIVRNEKPTTSGGIHEVIDDVHKTHTAIKETLQENINN